RPDLGHRRELGARREDARSASESARRERRERVDPLAPRGSLGERLEIAEQRQREITERIDRFEIALDRARLVLFGDATRLRGVVFEFLAKPVEPPLPA